MKLDLFIIKKENIFVFWNGLAFCFRVTDAIPNYETANREGALAWGELVKSKADANKWATTTAATTSSSTTTTIIFRTFVDFQYFEFSFGQLPKLTIWI